MMLKKYFKELVIMFLLAAAVFPLSGAKPGVVFLSPAADEIWNGRQMIRVHLVNIPPQDVEMVELYLDGSLLREFKAPPFELWHHFGVLGQNRYLKAVARGKNNTVLAESLVKSFQVFESHDVEVRQIVVPVVVKDRKGNYVRGLTKDDFTVYSDGRKVNIKYLGTSGAERFTMVQVIDISYSMRHKIHDVLQGAKEFVKHIMTPNDRCSVVYFNHRVWEHSGFTNNIGELQEKLELHTPIDGETALHDAVAYSLKLLNKIPGWKMVVVFSDGEDNQSYTNKYSLIRKVSQSPVVIYAIDNHIDRNDEILREICSKSGGAVYPLANVKKTAKVYDKIREEIKAQYVIYFTPPDKRKPNASRFHSLTVKLKNKKYKVRTIKGYY